MKPVALFSNIHMLPGLHVTLFTLLQSLKVSKQDEFVIHLFLDSVPSKEKELLKDTYSKFKEKAKLEITDYSPKSPTGEDLYYGNETVYGRINLANLLSESERCVYLDCDLIVNMSIGKLFECFDDEHILFVDGTEKREHSLDKKLFMEAGLDLKGSCFNSGVMGINLSLWRKKNVDETYRNTATKFRGMFKTADQALLNTALHSSFKSLGSAYNTLLYTSSPRVESIEEHIYHLVESPKPWDFLGRFASNHYNMWKHYYEQTAISKKWPLRYSSFKRTSSISMQLIRSLKSRIK